MMKPAAAKRVKEALKLLVAVGIPKEQQNERSALTLLALADLAPRSPWKDSSSPLRRITQMMDWMGEHYGVRYAPNTRETIRRQTVHQFVQHGLVLENPDDPERPINSPKWCYQLSPQALKLLRSMGTPEFSVELATFLASPSAGVLQARHRDLPRESVLMPDGVTIELSAGGQNTLIRAIIQEFIPRFVRKPRVLLLGDAANKEVISHPAPLKALGITMPERGKAPDALVHDQERDWLIVIEAVTSHGPIDQKRKNELEHLFATARPGLVFVSTFPDRKTFTKHHAKIAWETEVWIADAPDHMIHYNGVRFLGPYPSSSRPTS
ncbi:MAG: restriction endonuclease [Verrucomicrobia bacterium]|nr:MAG: restriction endonuclease [Verrucomicrobiota bacterium]TAE86976.1 MAG: restriction endonuclease [Verrucomicrobiota bacterium]TAF24767.1 MAG: restriction endonuclease [Verrucomicrobiota bacterium]